MVFPVLRPEIQEYIKANEKTDVSLLALGKNPFPTVEWREIVAQIDGRQKSKEKLPTWYATANIVYPTKLSIEQTSSEKTAAYKAKLIAGSSIIDLTGGFGVDSYFFSKRFQSVIHCEVNSELSAIAENNFESLDINNIRCIAGDSTKVLSDLSLRFDWIYLDPSRRNDLKGKIFLLKDCLPNVPEQLNFYFQFSDKILIKTSPLLDISAGMKEMKFVKKIHIVATDNEVKELIWEIEKNYILYPEIVTVNFQKETSQNFSFVLNQAVVAKLGVLKTYLYEPNRAIMKSGGFDQVSVRFNIDKLHPNSHLYTANELIDFPGRVFRIDNILPYQKKEIKKYLASKKANIAVRNFPESVHEIRKKWNISDGGELYCFFTTDVNDVKIMLLCSKIKE